VNEAVFAWDEPLPASERDALIARVAHEVTGRGLQTPVLLLLEIHRPAGFLMSQGLIVLGPILAGLVGLDRIQTLSRFLREPNAIDRLIAAIEETR
jgi:hypothetical protein